MKKTAFLTGITGQDASYLAELLLSKDYDVHGLIRRSSSMCNRKWIDGLDITLHYGDLTDSHSLDYLIGDIQFDEIYNLGSMSHVGISFELPVYTFQVNTIGVLNLLESCRKFNNQARIYQASTSEMLALPIHKSVNEEESFIVHSPYACSKLAAHELCKIYREAYGLHVCCGILFNHESERRGDNFVTQKIVKNLIKMKKGLIQSFELGNTEVYRDWGYAKDYVQAMWLMLQQEKPDDYVIATNESHSVKEFIEECCFKLDMNVEWIKIMNKINYQVGTVWNEGKYCGNITCSSTEKRPWDVQYLRGDYSKAKRILGWEPTVRFKELIRIMIRAELEMYEK